MTAKRRTEREVARTLRLDRVARSVEELRRAALAAEQEFAVELDAAAPSMRESAYNLVHYLNELGAETRVHRNDAITVAEALGMQPEAILLSPGPYQMVLFTFVVVPLFAIAALFYLSRVFGELRKKDVL